MEQLQCLRNSILVVLIGLTLTAHGQEFGCDSLNAIIAVTKNFDFTEKKAFAEKRYANFDFKKFVGYGNPSANNYFQVGTDKDGRLVYVSHVDSRKNGNLGEYKLSFFFLAEFTIVTLATKEWGRYNYPPCAFIRFSDHGNFYLVTYRNLFEKIPVVSDSFIPFDDFSELYTIMYFDPDFKPKKLIRLNHGEIVFTSNFIQTGNTEKEVISLYPKSFDVKVNNSTCLSAIPSKLENILYVFETKAGKGIGYESAPIWLWGGDHHYTIR